MHLVDRQEKDESTYCKKNNPKVQVIKKMQKLKRKIAVIRISSDNDCAMTRIVAV